MTRKSAIAHLAHKIIGCKATGESKVDGVNVVALEMAVSALQERKHGKWIWVSNFDDCDGCAYTCSECAYRAYGNTGEVLCGEYKYCQHCGAKLEVEDDE